MSLKHAPVRCVIVLTTGRAGSLWLAWALQQLYYSVLSLHEAGVYIKDLAFDYYNDIVDLPTAIDRLRDAKLQAVLDAKHFYKKTHYIEVNRNMCLVAEPLRRALTHDRIDLIYLGLVGDGRVFVRSMANKGAYEQHRKHGWWRPFGHPDWEEYSQVEKLAYHWVRKVDLITDAIPAYDIFRLEDITGTLRSWNTMATTMGLPPTRSGSEFHRVRKQRKNHVPCNTYREFSDISVRDQEAFWSIAGQTMRKLGY